MDERSLIEYVTRQRWYGAKSRTVSHSEVLDTVTIRQAEPQLSLALVDIDRFRYVNLKRNGSVDRALASYNAGDGNVDTWTSPGRDDPDVFTEYVPFEETHNYVKRIQLYWWVNRYLWLR